MLARAIFVRPTTRLRTLHTASPRDPWPQPSPSLHSPMDQVADDVESTPSTHRGAAQPATASSAHRDIFDSWKFDSFYAPLDFLRSRRTRTPVLRRRNTRSIGPDAREALYGDAFRQLDIDPVEEANNSALLSGFMTGMGKIRPRSFTGLSWRSQRKVTQAIKRAKQKGVLAILSNKYSTTKSVY